MMTMTLHRWLICWLIAGALDGSANGADDPLPSWNEGPTKQAIVDFVTRVTREGGADFVAVPERIATFDNDGTLWCEQPNYVQAFFIVDRVKALAPQHPEWKEKEPFRTILAGKDAGTFPTGEHALVELVAATHSGMTVTEFDRTVSEWIATARHPGTKRLFTRMVYQPMLELQAWLRENRFKTYIVSGGGVDFMRPWVDRVYGIPPEQIIGSRGKLKFELIDGRGELLKLPAIDLIDDGPGKPVGIGELIGRRPVMAFGNSDGDLQMLQYTTTGAGARFGLIVHHTDAEREYAYDRKSHVGRLDKALDEAGKRGWTVVDMKKDWKVIFPGEK